MRRSHFKNHYSALSWLWFVYYYLFMIKTLIYFMIHQRMQFNFSNLYPIGGPAFLLTQVCLVCPWVLYNGQITDLVFCTYDTTINFDSILLFLLLPLKVSTVGGINESIQRSLITVSCKGSAPSAYISLQIFNSMNIWTVIFWISSDGGKEFDGMSTRSKFFLVKSTRTFIFLIYQQHISY